MTIKGWTATTEAAIDIVKAGGAMTSKEVAAKLGKWNAMTHRHLLIGVAGGVLGLTEDRPKRFYLADGAVPAAKSEPETEPDLDAENAHALAESPKREGCSFCAGTGRTWDGDRFVSCPHTPKAWRIRVHGDDGDSVLSVLYPSREGARLGIKRLQALGAIAPSARSSIYQMSDNSLQPARNN